MQWKLNGIKMVVNHSVVQAWGARNWVYALVGPFTSPRRYASFLGMSVTLCLAKVSALSQIFPPLAWQCSRILVWSSTGILSHLPTCSKSQDCFSLEHFLSWKQKKEQYFFERSEGSKSPTGVPSLHRSRPAFVKSFEPAPTLSFGFLECLSQAGVPGGDHPT